MRITAKKLKIAGACKGDVKAFEKRWPDGCNVTRENCRIAFRTLKMDVEWAAENLLSGGCQSVIDAGANACKKCRTYHVCDFPPYCKFDEARIEAFYQLAKG